MRTKLIWSMFTAAALLGGTACKKNDSEKAGSAMQKAQEREDNAKKDLRDEQKDVANEQKDVVKEQRNVEEAQAEIAAARVDLSTALKTRLNAIDDKLIVLDAKATDKAKAAAAGLHQRRNELATRMEAIPSMTSAALNEARKDTTDAFDKLAKDLKDAID